MIVRKRKPIQYIIYDLGEGLFMVSLGIVLTTILIFLIASLFNWLDISFISEFIVSITKPFISLLENYSISLKSGDVKLKQRVSYTIFIFLMFIVLFTPYILNSCFKFIYRIINPSIINRKAPEIDYYNIGKFCFPNFGVKCVLSEEKILNRSISLISSGDNSQRIEDIRSIDIAPKSLLQKIFDFGTIIFRMPNPSSNIEWKNVLHPESVKSDIQKYINKEISFLKLIQKNDTSYLYYYHKTPSTKCKRKVDEKDLSSIVCGIPGLPDELKMALIKSSKNKNSENTILTWEVKNGDFVEKGQVIATFNLKGFLIKQSDKRINMHAYIQSPLTGKFLRNTSNLFVDYGRIGGNHGARFISSVGIKKDDILFYLQPIVDDVKDAIDFDDEVSSVAKESYKSLREYIEQYNRRSSVSFDLREKLIDWYLLGDIWSSINGVVARKERYEGYSEL